MKGRRLSFRCSVCDVSINNIVSILLALYTFRSVRKIAKKRQLASSCLSVRPHATTRFPLDGFAFFVVFGAAAPNGPGPPHSRGF